MCLISSEERPASMSKNLKSRRLNSKSAALCRHNDPWLISTLSVQAKIEKRARRTDLVYEGSKLLDAHRKQVRVLNLAEGAGLTREIQQSYEEMFMKVRQNVWSCLHLT